jgi:hypothetical protein
MPTAGRPKLTIRLGERELREFQAAAHNQGLTAAELGRQLIVDYLAQTNDQEPKPS